MSLLIDLTHTSHTRARTGIQRVSRAVHSELAKLEPTIPLCFDPYQRGWRPLENSERTNLADTSTVNASRGARWTLLQKLKGHAKHITGRKLTPPSGSALICPELFSPQVAAHLPVLFHQVRGPRVAIFHDAIGLKFPELTPPATVARLPLYLRELAQFDGVAAVSEDSAQTLREFWDWAELRSVPPVISIPLGIAPVNAMLPAPAPIPTLLCVSTLEGRKNHLALLDAAESLWNEGLAFKLELIGMPRADTGRAALLRIKQLVASGRPIIYHGAVSDSALDAAYARSALTIYPSLYEGFGLPVLESLQHGCPCLSSSAGALKETAEGGGVQLLPSPDASTIAATLRDLLRHPEKLALLAQAARARQLRTWAGYSRDLLAWMAHLPRH